MPRGGPRPGAGRPKSKPSPAPEPKPVTKKPGGKKAAAPTVDAQGFKADDAPPSWPFGKEKPGPPPDLTDLMPLDYLLEVMRDPDEDRGRRMQAATLAAPYCHPKKGEAGKKEEKAAAAKKVASRFTPAAPPKLAAANGRKV